MIKRKLLKTLLTTSLCSLLVMLCLFSFVLDVQADMIIDGGTCGPDLTWTLDRKGNLTISGTGPMDKYTTNWSDPKYAPWYDIKDYVKSVEIQDGVTSISNYAFYECNKLSTVILSESIEEIQEYSFGYSFPSLKFNVYDNAEYLGNTQNPYLVLINVIDSEKTTCDIHPDTKVIAESAFSYSAITSVVLPNGLTHINSYAFYSCPLTSIQIPNTVEHVGKSAFTSSDLQFNTYKNAKYLGNENSPYTVLFGVTDPSLSNYSIHSDTKIIGSYAFDRCEKITTIKIPGSVTCLAYGAFQDCISLENIKIPENVSVIDSNAFRNCQELQTVTLSEGVETIKDSAFEKCFSLNSIKLPDSLTYIGTSAFRWCSSLKFLTLPKDISNYGKNSLSNCYNLKQIIFQGDAPNSITAVVKPNGQKIYYPEDNKTWKSIDYIKSLTLISYKPVKITGQPKNASVIIGDKAKVSVSASGEGLTYQWYIKNNGASSYTKSSIKTSTYSCKMSSSTNGRYVKCKITDKYGNSVWTNSVRLKMKELAITSQPVSKTVKDGAIAKYTVKPNGSNVTYQWQYRTSSSGSWKNTTATGCKTKTLSISATTAKHGYQYRCKITDSAGNTVYTKTVSLYVLGIKAQPVSKSVKVGATAKFTVKATGKGLTYQWQYKTSDGSWKNVSAASGKKATYSLTTATRHNGYQYRCKITDSAGNVIYSNIVKLTVKK